MRPRISRLGEETWLVEFEPRMDPEINDHVLAMARALEERQIGGILDIVPAIASLAVHVDAERVDESQLGGALESLIEASVEAVTSGVTHVVPVCYDGPHAPDLRSVAEWSGCSESEVVARHTALLYRVFMIGFLPGFAYLGSVDPRIAAPRRETPRLRVLAGSVGIAGRQTGIYPSDSPGGWQIIGRTPLVMFDMAQQPPVLMQAGDRVRFAPIDIAEFDRRATRREAAR